MATGTELVRAIVNENDYLKNAVLTASVRLENASLKDIAEPIISDPLARNKFISDLYNKFIASEVQDRVFDNPLKVLKKGKYLPYGDTVERMVVNPAKAISYSDKDDNILTTVRPDVKVEYIKVNREDKYPISIPLKVLQQAFASETGWNAFYSACINSLYSGDNIDEFMLMKKIISDMSDADFIINTAVNPKDGDATTVNIINIFDYMTFPSTYWNAYSRKYPDSKLTTWCPANELVLVGTADFLNNLQVSTLAAKFNLSEINLTDNIIKIDGFGSENNEILCAILDKGFMQVHDTLYELDSFQRADTLEEKSYLHHWQTMQGSLLANACCLCRDETSTTTYSVDMGSAKKE